MRGELRFASVKRQRQNGSSPHAWGTPPSSPRAPPRSRFIPTCVGNSAERGARGGAGTVHPHMRGELRTLSRTSGPVAGSSPHAWGTPRARDLAGRTRRFIPTCVGNSDPAATPALGDEVHPHMRGELLVAVWGVGGHYGSSPHAWGTPYIRPGKTGKVRFIPTCVGNSTSPATSRRVPSVHPHMRGELGLPRTLVPIDDGSSPHAWGTHFSLLSPEGWFLPSGSLLLRKTLRYRKGIPILSFAIPYHGSGAVWRVQTKPARKAEAVLR